MNEFFRLLQQGIAWILHVVWLLYEWSFGQVWRAIRLLANVDSLPIWKTVLIVIVAMALAIFIWRIFSEAWDAVRMLLNAVVGIFVAIVANIKPLLVLGVVAFGGAWVVNNVTLPLP